MHSKKGGKTKNREGKGTTTENKETKSEEEKYER